MSGAIESHSQYGRSAARLREHSGLTMLASLLIVFREMMEAGGFFTIVPELGARPDDVYITKKTWNAFYDTPLEVELRRLGVTQIVLCGIATSIGVEGTARAAYERGFNVAFVEDAITDLVATAHENSLTSIFPRLGEIGSTESVIGLLAKR